MMTDWQTLILTRQPPRIGKNSSGQNAVSSSDSYLKPSGRRRLRYFFRLRVEMGLVNLTVASHVAVSISLKLQ